MEETLQVFILTLLFSFILCMQFNMDADTTATRQMKNAAELAVHDASLALDENELRQGKLVFDQVNAEQYLLSSLQTNLDLDTSLQPTTESFYQVPIEVELLEYFDESNTTFPYVYSNPTYNILDVLNGPSVVAVFTTTSPRYFAGDGIEIRQAAVYEYLPY